MSWTSFRPKPKKKHPVAAPQVDPGGQPYVQPDPSSAWQDSTYNTTTGSIAAGLGNLKGYLLNAGTALGADYGVDFDRDPNDPLKASNFRIADNVDVTNPFSKAAALKRAYQEGTRGNTNSYAARGQLYAGSLQNAQNETGRQNLANQDSLLKSFGAQFGDLYGKYLAGENEAAGQGIEAQGLAIERHLGDPASTRGFQNISFKNLPGSGLKVTVKDGKFVVTDASGRVVRGATIHSQWGKRYIRVPRGV